MMALVPGSGQALRDFSSLESLPGTACWAKFSRPCGTEFAIATLSCIYGAVEACAWSVDVTHYLNRNYNFGVEFYIDTSFTCYRLRFSIWMG
jgi:hypothetical protein